MKKVLLLALLFIGLSAQAQLLPKPVSVTNEEGEFNLSAQTKLMVDDQGDFTQEVFALQEAIQAKTGSFLATGHGGANLISVKKSAVPNATENAYKLTITSKQIALEAGTTEGIYYGVQSLKQLMDTEGLNLNAKTIIDYPSYGWRGLMLDVSRHFYPLEYLKQQIELLAYYKMNRLHLHLTDDEGWRIEIKSLPELTQKSAFRDFDRHDSAVIRRTAQDKRIALDPRFLQEQNGKVRYGGFYTQDEIKDLVRFAEKHHVELVPEIDMPGHMMAAILAYPELCSTGKPSWGSVFSQPLCPAKEEVFTFVTKVLDEIMAIFPSKYVHIGADEVDKTTWKASDLCQQLMKKENLKDEHALQSWFVERVSNYLKGKGKEVVVWDDALEGGISKDINVMYWRDFKAATPFESVAAGHETIFCPGTPLYFSRRDSASYDIYHLRSFQELTVQNKKLIKGAQANVWAEQVGNSDWANLLIWPRMLALAELTWTPYEERNWEDFKRRAALQRTYLAGLGIDLAKESPFLTVVQKTDMQNKGVRFHFEHEKINPQLVYTVDGTEPTANSKPFIDHLLVKKPCTLKVGILENGEILQPVFTRPVEFHKGVGLKVKYLQPWHKNYPGAKELTLTNGLQGDDYYKDTNWQGFTNDLEVVIDLEKNTGFKEMSLRFMQICNEDVLIPGFVEIAVSDDGEHFRTHATIQNDVDPTQRGLIFKVFKTNLKGAKGRYLKVLAKNVHPEQFIFTDEILLR